MVVRKICLKRMATENKVAWCEIRRNGWPLENVVIIICSTLILALWKNTIEEQPHIFVKIGGALYPFVNVGVIRVQLCNQPVFQRVLVVVGSHNCPSCRLAISETGPA